MSPYIYKLWQDVVAARRPPEQVGAVTITAHVARAIVIK